LAALLALPAAAAAVLPCRVAAAFVPPADERAFCALRCLVAAPFLAAA
jgi:hypothetical protein